MRIVHVVATALIVSLGFVVTVGRAAPEATETQERPFLLALRGNVVTINYTPGALDRAVHVQRRLELLAYDFSRWTGVEVKLRVFVLSRDEWTKFGFMLPYGLPGRIGESTLAVPSYGDATTVELWNRIRGVPLVPLPGIPLKGTAEEAASLALSDLMMEVEAARVLLSIGGVRGETPWLHQILAHLLARAAFERYEAPRMSEIDALFASLGQQVPAPLPIERYAPGLDLDSFLWFESRFNDGARTVMESGKKNETKALIKQAMKSSRALTQQAFFDLHPEMRHWLADTFVTTAVPGG